jgi:hypothetical protein
LSFTPDGGMSFAAQTMRLTEKFINPLERNRRRRQHRGFLLEGVVEVGFDDLRCAAIAALSVKLASLDFEVDTLRSPY